MADRFEEEKQIGAWSGDRSKMMQAGEEQNRPEMKMVRPVSEWPLLTVLLTPWQPQSIVFGSSMLNNRPGQLRLIKDKGEGKRIYTYTYIYIY